MLGLASEAFFVLRHKTEVFLLLCPPVLLPCKLLMFQ